MSEPENSDRGELIRRTVIFQLKLMADGLRDLLLIPVSLVATVVGLLRGGSDPAREFNQVLDIGRQSETWINLFENHDASDHTRLGDSIDVVFTKVETALKQEYQTGEISKSAQTKINEALKAIKNQSTP